MDAARNRAAVLAAARQMLTAGEDALAMNVVARRAGVGVGTVYRHFPTRQALLENLAAPSLSSLVDTAREAAEDPDPGSGLQLLLRAALLAQLADPVLAVVLATTDRVCPETLLLSTDFGRHVHQLLDNARRVGAVGEDVAPDDLRRLLCGVVAAAQAGPDPNAAADRYLRLLLAALRSSN